MIVRCFFAAALLVSVTAPARAADFNPPKGGTDLTSVRAAIKARNYQAALSELKSIVVQHDEPDVYSLLGFTSRKTGNQAQALTYYQKALALDPTHRGALEYQGELFVEMGQIEKAKENLARLTKVCTFGCEEKDDLKEAIEHATKAKS